MAENERSLISLFGFKVTKEEDKRKRKEEQDKSLSPISPTNDDGSLVIDAAVRSYDSYLNIGHSTIDEHELITKYREMEMHPDCDSAVDDITNESIGITPDGPLVELDFEDTSKLPEALKKKIRAEFKTILRLLDYRNKGYFLFRRWYVDGRLIFHAVTERQNEKKGIQELRYIDPRQIKKIREQHKKRIALPNGQTIEVFSHENEYFIYNQNGLRDGVQTDALTFYHEIGSGCFTAYKIAPDSIVYCHSGIVDKFSNTVFSHLNKAIYALNQLKMMEDSSVIYRIVRAPERRIFYVDVGSLPKQKADQYLKSVMQKFRNRFSYNKETGETDSDKAFYSMQEDYWIPRREGASGTQVDTLPGGDNLGEIRDIEYFQRKFYKALNVPIGRLDSQNNFNVGRVTEITRDEIKFDKFIQRLRARFSTLFLDLLEKQLLLKGYVTGEEFTNIVRDEIRFNYSKDNYFSEMKTLEIMEARMRVLREVQEYVGMYFSRRQIREEILGQTLEKQKLLDQEIKSENADYKDKAEDEFDILSTLDPNLDPEAGGDMTQADVDAKEPEFSEPEEPETPQPEDSPEDREKKRDNSKDGDKLNGR